MHFTFIFVGFLASLTVTYSHPTKTSTSSPVLERKDSNPQRARPIQQFFKNILSALQRTTTPEPPSTSTTNKPLERPSFFQSNIELHEIPNFVDFSTHLLNSFVNNNSAIKFSYMQPNISDTPALRGNFSVITFLVPNENKINEEKKDDNSKGIFSFLGNMRLPWTPPPSNTDYSQFPPLIELFTQRVQAYFSVYKYNDDSRLNNTIVMFLPEQENDDTAGESATISGDEGVDTTTDYQMNAEAFTDGKILLQADEITTFQADETTTDISAEMK